MISNLVIRVKDITEEQSIEVRDFLKQKEIKHELYLSAFAAWNMEEAENMLWNLYNEVDVWGDIKIKENQTEKEFIDDNKELLADKLADDDYLNQSMNDITADIAIEALKENGYLDEDPVNIEMKKLNKASIPIDIHYF